MYYYIISGEASGDLHGSNLMKAIKDVDTEANFRFWGGDKMNEVGGELVVHYRHMAFMGFYEVFKNLRYILKKMDFCKADILQHRPDAIILIDYPGFNLRIAEFAKKNNFKVFYYISPQVWAWKSSRVVKIKRFVDKMFVILPFEKQFYKNWDYDVEYVGHPLVDIIPERLTKPLTNTKVVALLPGSRQQEIKIKLPIMVEVANHLNDVEFIVAKAPSAELSWYQNALKLAVNNNIEVVENNTYEILKMADAAIVTSGTATLETALLNVPQVVCYKGSWLSYQIGKRLVKIKYISLVNLIMDKQVVKELIQEKLTPQNLLTECNLLLYNSEYRNEIITNYALLRNKLNKKNAAKNTAGEIYNLLKL